MQRNANKVESENDERVTMQNKTCFNKKSCRWRVDTQVWNERGRSCFTVKCELWVLEAEVLKCSIELMRTNTHGLNLTILNNVRAYFITRTQPMSKCLLTHSHIFFHSILQAQTSALFPFVTGINIRLILYKENGCFEWQILYILS